MFVPTWSIELLVYPLNVERREAIKYTIKYTIKYREQFLILVIC